MPNIIAELKKRKVFNTAAIYLATSFLILQAAAILIPALLIPDWTISFMVVLVILGFPVMLIFSWIYDVTPDGVIRTDKDKSLGNTNYINIFLILVIIGGCLFYFQDSFFKPTVNVNYKK